MLIRRLHGCGIVLLLVCLLLSNVSGALSKEQQEEEESKRRSLATGMFYVAIQGTDPTTLQTGLNFACGPRHADCSLIQPNGKCYKANNLPALASYAYNNYYQLNAASSASCNFSGTATTTPDDPSKMFCCRWRKYGLKSIKNNPHSRLWKKMKIKRRSSFALRSESLTAKALPSVDLKLMAKYAFTDKIMDNYFAVSKLTTKPLS